MVLVDEAVAVDLGVWQGMRSRCMVVALRRRTRVQRKVVGADGAIGSVGYSVVHVSNDSKIPSPVSTSTLVTAADRGPLRAQSMIRSSASRGPATIASTDPSRQLRTPPRTPNRRASWTIDQR